MFERIIDLKNSTFPEGYLNIEGENAWKAWFKWGKTLSAEEADFLHKTSDIPTDYLEFLRIVADGAIIYYEQEFGQWGFELFSHKEFALKQGFWRENLVLPNNTRYLAFCELYGENTVLVFDTTDTKLCVLEANCYFPPTEWTRVAHSLDEWLDQLIDNGGEKYWD